MYTVIEASRLLGCSKNHIYKHIEEGNIKTTTDSRGKLQIPPKVLEKFKARHIEGSKRVGRYIPSRGRVPIKKRGYVLIHTPGHLKADHEGYVPEHVLVMELKIGRSLTKDESVHHLNHKREDNRPENLVLYATFAEHRKEAHGFALYVDMRTTCRPKLQEAIRELIESWTED